MISRRFKRTAEGGYSLLELALTLGVLSVLVMGTIPMAQNAVKRQKEQRLREELRLMRRAIDEFKRDTFGSCPQGVGSNTTAGPVRNLTVAPTDPRSRVVIDDCTIFDTQNLDRYPPTLDTLVNGVAVRPRGVNMASGSGLGNTPQASDLNQDEPIIKVYLREVPVDPMTGEKDWIIRSTYQPADSESWDEINVFDVRSASQDEALDGTKYSDW